MDCEEDTDFDEDVILPNSPLDCYVKGLECFKNSSVYEECFSKQTENTKTLQPIEKEKSENSSSDKFSLKSLFQWAFKINLRALSPIVALSIYLLLEFSCFHKSLNIVQKFKLLSQEDEEFLVTFKSESKRIRKKKLSDIVIMHLKYLIQEVELIARGFTTASVTGAAERIELSSALPVNSCYRQYSTFRKHLFSWMKDVFKKYRYRTTVILNKIPFDPGCDFPVCLAALKMEEFGGLLNYDLNSNELMEITDNFSISSLKTMYHLMEMQVSEFFKYFVFATIVIDNSPKHWKHVGYARNLQSTVDTLSKEMLALSKNVENTYEFYLCIETTYLDNKRKSYPTEPKTVTSALEIIAHNINLRLKSSLLSSIEMEKCLNFEKCIDPQKYIKEIQYYLGLIKSQVSNIDDDFNELDKVLNTFVNSKQKLEVQSTIPVFNEEKNQGVQPVLEKCDIEREITDEVFEDTITNAVKGTNKQENEFYQEEVKKNTEMASRLLKELKNVLVVKADEHRSREQIALAKKLNEANLDCISNESEETVNLAKDITEDPVLKSSLTSDEEMNDKDDCIEDDVRDSASFCFVPSNNSFTASIASLAAERQKLFGLSSEEFIDGTDESETESESS
ncbi:vezatin [Trichonephila inaurata madagascariensis]|uniref:Vezatin n=1 Tax=Trichonephila inaurata madagascariensis TaxID=2747483 RepID=A0A8X6JJC8_9ARAC|nr:vezatin [Trichonephila inaurata madagascariensis]